MYDDGDAVDSQDGFLQPLSLFAVLQIPGGQANVAGAILNCFDAGTGAGTVVGKVCTAIILHKGLTKSKHHLLHGGRAIGGYGLFFLAAAGRQASHQHQDRKRDCNYFFHIFSPLIWITPIAYPIGVKSETKTM